MTFVNICLRESDITLISINFFTWQTKTIFHFKPLREKYIPNYLLALLNPLFYKCTCRLIGMGCERKFNFTSLCIYKTKINDNKLALVLSEVMQDHWFTFLAHLSHSRLQPMCVVRRATCVMRRQQLLQTTSPLKPLGLES